MNFISYAQNFEDVLLWRALRQVEAGFYIDIGAHHPDHDSVTRAFSDRGWHGINVEPLAAEAALLRAARPRDITLQVALGATPGRMPFHVIEGTGLSTLDPEVAASYDAEPFTVRESEIDVLTLAQICTLHAAVDIHFLKIDVEGAEFAVLRGADLSRFRPWIILVEATEPGSTTPNHQAWEPLLLAADYVFVWFDGLNRFYVAAERAYELRPAFLTPPNTFDQFVRAGDNSWIGKFADAELDVRVLRSQLASVQVGLEQSAKREQQHVEHAGHDISRLRESLARAEGNVAQMRAEDATLRHQIATAEHMFDLRHRDMEDLRAALQKAEHELQQTHVRLQQSETRLQESNAELRIMAQSRSWRITAPLRRTRRWSGFSAGTVDPGNRTGMSVEAQAVQSAFPESGDDPTEEPNARTVAGEDTELWPLPVTPPPPFMVETASPGGLTAIHQFHSGSAVNDAITNAMLLTRTLLRSMGYDSEIYTEQPPAALAGELRTMEELPRHDRYVLLLHHSMGYDRFEQILALPAPKVLIYHNITPPELLVRHPHLAHYAKVGRAQLGLLRGKVAAALAISAYNANELRALGLTPVRTCTLLFDIDRLRKRADAAAERATSLRRHGVFTILFVGRINESKGQSALIDAYAAFRRRYAAPSRLVLVGRSESAADPYATLVRQRIESGGLGDHVLLTGSVADEMLDAWYNAADLYVSLSRHEGFGAPLVEAMVHGVPVMAYPGGAVPYTLGGAARLVSDVSPDIVADAMLTLADDPEARAAQRAMQTASLDRFALSRQRTVLLHALLRAGAALPSNPASGALLSDNLCFSVAGHVNGSYSLASINRDLALCLEAARPGRVRLLPVEGGATLDLSGVPVEQADAIRRLVFRPPHPTGPEMVVSQHYPVHVPACSADLKVALLFWEESRIPAGTIAGLSRDFHAVVAPSRIVRDALIDSGIAVPVRVIAPAFRLDRFAALRAARPLRAASATHRFLHVSSCFPRKGVDVLLRAWARAFRDTDPVHLVIKGFPNPHNEVAGALEALRSADPGLAPVTLIDRDLDPAELMSLYADADTMVLPTRGEGLNLPAAEALTAGLGLIVTGAGGHMDFCTGPDGIHPGIRLLEYRHAPSASHLSTPHSLWLEPDEDDLVAALREHASASYTPIAPPAFPGPDTLARGYSDLAVDLLLAEPHAPARVSWVSSWAVRCGVAEYSRQLLGNLPRVDEGGYGMQVRVLCDRRTAADPGDPAAAWPCWDFGDPRTVPPLVGAIGADDAQAVVVQHQPGLFSFETLAEIIAHPSRHGRVVVVTLHNTRDLLDMEASGRSRVIAALHSVDRVLVHTATDLDRLRGLGLLEHVTLLPHGVPASLPASRIRRFTDDDPDIPGAEDPLIGCYGFFLPGKGIDTLIHAFSVLRRRWPKARLRLVNAAYDPVRSDSEIDRCQRLIAELGLTEAVALHTTFLPNFASMTLLNECDVVALPYLPSKEASSAALRGALAAGVPVAVTPIALFDEAHSAVFRFSGIDCDAVAAGLGELLEDGELRLRVQQEAQDWMGQRRWADIARLMEGMITGLVRSKTIERTR